jgi:drug/metabolite transporter (DMT)-like permease
MHVRRDRGGFALDARTVTALCVVYIAWGATYPAIRVMVETVPPLIGTGARFLIAGVALYAFLAARRGRWKIWESRRELAGAAVVGTLILGDIGLLAVAEQEVPAGLAALLIASVPVWIVVLRVAHRESVAVPTIGAVVVGLGGVAVLVTPGQGAGGAPVAWLLLVVLAAVIEAVGQFSATRAPLLGDAFASTAVQLLAAAVVLVAVGLAVGEAAAVRVERFSGASVAAFAYLVGPGSLLAYSAFVWLLGNAPLSLVSTYAYVNPLVAVFLGWALLSEAVTSVMAAGALAILASVALIVRHDTAAHSQPSPLSHPDRGPAVKSRG